MATALTKAPKISRAAMMARRVRTRAATAVQPIVQPVTQTVRRVYSAARGGVSRLRGVAANAKQRAQSALSGVGGKILIFAIGVAAMVALVPVLTRLLKLDQSPNGKLWLAGIFLAISAIFFVFVKKPLWGLMAAGVAGFIGGSEILSRWTSPPTRTQMQPQRTQQQLPADRVVSSRPQLRVPQATAR